MCVFSEEKVRKEEYFAQFIDKLLTYRFSRGRLARKSIVPVNWLFCRFLNDDK